MIPAHWVMSPQAHRRLTEAMRPEELRDLATEICEALGLDDPEDHTHIVAILSARQ